MKMYTRLIKLFGANNFLNNYHSAFKATSFHAVFALALLFSTIITPLLSNAQSASDNGCNYGGGWTNGSNNGSGFAGWAISIGSGGGTYITTDANLNTNSCATAFGIYSGSSAVTTSVARPLASSGTMQVNQTFTVDLDNGGINSGGSEGLSLWNSNGSAVFELYYANGNSGWSIHDNTSTTVSSIPYGSIHVIFTLTSSTTYSLTVKTSATGQTSTYGPYTGTLISQSPQAISQFRFYAFNIGSGNNLQFNNLSLVCPTPTVTTQPTVQTVCSSSSAVYTVASTTAANPSYRWRKNGVNLSNGSQGDGSSVSGATSAILTLSSITSSNTVAAGVGYDCVITDGCSATVTSNRVALTVNDLVSIGTQPTTQTVCTAGTSTFTLGASGSGLTYQWRKNGSNISNGATGNGSTYSGATTNTLTIASTAAGDAVSAGSGFDCVVSGTSPCGSVTSTRVGLNVTASIVVNTQPTDQTSCATAGTASFSISVTAASPTYQWRLNGTNLTDGAQVNGSTVSGATTATLSLTGLSAPNSVVAGSGYDCVVSSSCGSPVTSSRVALTVSAASVAGSSSSSSICSGNTGSVTLTGYTGSIQWQQSTTGSSGWANVSGGSGGTTATYTTPALTSGLYYQAVVTNGTCSAATSSSILISIKQSNSAASIYGGSWTNGQNDNSTGFGAWSFSPATNTAFYGYFVGASGTVDVSSSAWGLYANTSNTANAVRPLSSAMTVGQALNFSMANNSVQSGGTVGFSLYNASGNALMEFYFSGGSTFYTIHDNSGTPASTISFNTNAMKVGLVYTSSAGQGTYALAITIGATTYNYTGTFLSVGGGQVPNQIRFFNFNAGSSNNFYVNSLTLDGPTITTQPTTGTQNVGVNATPSNISIASSGANLSYQWYYNTTGSSSSGSQTAVGTNSPSCTPLTSTAGTYYYYCVVSGNCSSSITSNQSGQVIVTPAPLITSFSTANNNGTSTSGYVGTTVTITGTNLGSATALTVGGTSVFSNIITNTASTITFTAISGISGTITVTNANGSGTSGSSYADLGYITNSNGDWNATSPYIWLGGALPVNGANATIANTVTATSAVTNSTVILTINSGGSLTFSSSGALTATTVTNNGTLAMSAGTLTVASGGTLTNNTNGTSFSGGTVSFSGTGTVAGTYPITFNNFLSISGVVNLNTAPTINGTLTINTLGGVGTNSPYYGASSTLFYNAATTISVPYHRSYEWVLGTTSSASAGYPNNVIIGSNSIGCVLDADNSGTLQIGGTLTIGVASGSNSSLQMNEPTTPYPLTVVGSVTVNATGTLLLGNLVSSYVGDLYVKGSFTNNGTLNTNNRAVFFTGTSAQTISGSALNTSSGSTNNFPYLFISNTSASVSLVSNVTVSATLTISAGATINDAGNTLTVSGTSLVNNGTHSGAGKIILTASSDVTLTGTGTYQNLESALTSAKLIVGSNFIIAGNLTNTSGGIRGLNYSITFTGTGTFTNNSTMFGEFSGSTLSLVFNGTTTLAGSTGYLDAKDYTVGSAGTLICAAIGLNTNSTSPAKGTVTVNGTLQTSNSSGLWDGSTNNTTIRYSSGSFQTITLGGASTIVYNASGAQPISGSNGIFTASYFNLTCSNTGTKTMQSSLSLGGTLTFSTSSDFLSINGNTLTLNGSYISGTVNNLTSSSSSSLVLNCTGTGPFTLPNFTAINNLTINTSGQTYNLNSSPTISGTLTLTAGTFAVGSNTLTLSGPYIAGTVNNLTTTSSSSLVLNCTGTGPFTLPNFTAINGLTINSGTNTYNLNSSPTVSGAVTLTAGKLSIGSNTLTLSSTLTCSATNSLVGSSTSNLTIQGTVGSVYFSGTTSLNNITVNSGSMILRTALTLSGTVLVAGGKFEVGAITQSIPAFNMTSGTLQLDASSTVRFTGTYSASSGSTLNAYAIPTIATNSTISLEVTNNTTKFPGSGVIVNNGLSLGPVTTCMGNLVMALPNPANSVTWKSAGSTVLIYGILSLNSGVIVTTTNTDVLSAASVTNAGGAASYVSGPLGISATTTSPVTFPIGKGGNCRPVTFTYTTANAGNAAVIEQFEASFPGTIPTDVSFSRFGTRYYNIIQYQTGYAYTVGLNNGGATPTGTVKIIRRDGASATTNANATSFSSPTYTTSSSYTASTYLSNDVALVETAIPLTITASAQSKTYGAALSPLTSSYSLSSALPGSDNISSVTLTNSNTGNGNSPVTDVPGTYTITPSAAVFSSGVSGAYNITYNTGTLTVNAGTAGVWLGIASTNFNAVANWQSYSTPISSTNVSVGSGTTYLPVLTATSSINNLSLASGTTIGLNGQTLTINGGVTGTGTITSTSASSLTIGGTAGTVNFTLGNNTIKNLTLNGSSTATLGTQLNIVGGSTPGVVTIGSSATLTTGGNLVLKSDTYGTARIDQVLGSISGNVTVERYITAKAGRRFSFVGSPVTQTVRNAWQQQIYVTGTGTGGTPCGSTTGNGGTTDKYNSNGFDATINSANTILHYTATTTNNSHYVGIANTGVSLSPGTGYSVNIRGDRNSSNTTCDNQLNASSPMAPEAITLSASGTVTTGDLAVALNDKTVHTFTLLANPYPSQISFTALQASNSIINNKMWTFSPFGSGNFTTYANGAIVNGATGFDNTNGDYIASGQAFFVEANTNGSVTFHESHKCSGVVPNTNYFGANSDKMIRIGLYNNANTRLDEALVRYNSYGSKEYNNEWDAASLSLSSQALVSFKGSNKLAIATHPLSTSADTTQLGVAIKAGTYSLVFSQLESIDSFQSITLVDSYLGVSENVRHNSSYSFNVTSDTASKGTKRFKVVLGGANPLAVNFVGINATQNTNGVAVEWQVANEQSITSYIIERSTDGVHFSTINTIAAKGTSSYNTQDASVPVGVAKLYYRIKSLGFDGAYKYSTIATVVTHDSRLVGLTIYPNPVQRKLNITAKSVLIGSTCSVKITTTAGAVAFSKSNVSYTGNALSLDVTKLAAGVYMVELTDAKGNKLVDKFIKE